MTLIKTAFYLLIVTLGFLEIQEQEKENGGIEVVYHEKVELKNVDSIPEEFREMVLKSERERVSIYTLLIRDNQSLFKFEEVKFDLENTRLTKYDAKDYVYKNLENDSVQIIKTVQQETYKINDENPKWEWQLLENQKKIAGYNCIEAELKNVDCYFSNTFHSVRAWFSVELPYSNGPYCLGGLPGMILGVTLENDTVFRRIEAESVSFPKKDVLIEEVDFDEKIKYSDLCSKSYR